jgi:hypothetical protein
VEDELSSQACDRPLQGSLNDNVKVR